MLYPSVLGLCAGCSNHDFVLLFVFKDLPLLVGLFELGIGECDRTLKHLTPLNELGHSIHKILKNLERKTTIPRLRADYD